MRISDWSSDVCSSDLARICTVLIETDALGELLDHLLTEASIRTGRAGLRTGVTLLDTADQNVIGVALRMGVRANNFLCVHIAVSTHLRLGWGEISADRVIAARLPTPDQTGQTQFQNDESTRLVPRLKQKFLYRRVWR